MLATSIKIKHFFILLLTVVTLLLSPRKVLAIEVSKQEALFIAMLAGEIGNASRESVEMVANTVVNRIKFYRQYDKNINAVDVLLQKGQYVALNGIKGYSPQELLDYTRKKCPQQWRTLLQIARSALNGTLKDNTNGSTGYHKSSRYAKGEEKRAIDNRCLYKGKGKTCKQHVGHYFYYSFLGKLKHNSKYNGTDSIQNVTNTDGLAYGGQTNGTNASGEEENLEPVYNIPPECSEAIDSAKNPVSVTFVGTNMFDSQILTNMQDMMLKIYNSLSKLFMLGHGLMCYASEITPICIPTSAQDIFDCTITVPRLNYWIPGLVIYIVGFFMTMAIGMYFVDVSFKLGFAVLMLPLSLGLWPFPPTKGKFIENIQIVVHNAMLFAFAAIGTAYATTLIKNGILEDEAGWNDFWAIVDDSKSVSLWDYFTNHDKYKAYKDNLHKLSENFSLDATHILVILFCLIFAFKILGSSINDYLNRFFGEGSLGGAEGAMHHMGTQAIGYATSRTVAPAMRLARDIAVTQAGRGVEAIGDGISNLGNRINTNFSNSGKGNGPTPKQNSSNLTPPPLSQEAGNAAVNPAENNFNSDDKTPVENQNTNNNQGATGATGNQNTNNNQGATGATGNRNTNNDQGAAGAAENQNTNNNQGATGATGNQNTNNNQGATGATGNRNTNNDQGAAGAAENQNTNNNQGATGATGNQNTNNNQGATGATGNQNTNNNQGKEDSTSKQANNTDTQQNQGRMGNIKQQVKQATQKANNFTRPTGHSLTVGNMLKGIRHPKMAYNTIKQLAQKGKQDWKNAETMKDKGRLILKKSGQVVLRSVRGNIAEATKTSLDIVGSIVKNMGKDMRGLPNQWEKARQQGAQKKRMEEEEEEERRKEEEERRLRGE